MQRTILLNLVKNQKNGDGPGRRKRGTVLEEEKRDGPARKKRGTVLQERKEGRSCKKEKEDGPTKNKKRYNPQKRKETIIMENLETKIAKDLLSIEAIFLKPDDPFTWASGIKSPIYCDNRLTLTSPMVRNDVEEGLASLIQENFPGAEVLMGTSTAGIAHAAITADILGLPMGYVRGSSKDHGRKNQIEGRLIKGQKVVVVEDLISTGGSVIEVVNVLREAGAIVLGIVSIFTYNMEKSVKALSEAKVKNVSLSNFDTMVEVAAEQGYIKQEAKEKLIKFRNNPSDESWIG